MVLFNLLRWWVNHINQWSKGSTPQHTFCCIIGWCSCCPWSCFSYWILHSYTWWTWSQTSTPMQADLDTTTYLVVYIEPTKSPVPLCLSRFRFAPPDSSMINSRTNNTIPYRVGLVILYLLPCLKCILPLTAFLQVLFPNASPLLPIIGDTVIGSLKSMWLQSTPSSWMLKQAKRIIPQAMSRSFQD